MPGVDALFRPRRPLRFIEPSDLPPQRRRTSSSIGVAALLADIQSDIIPAEKWTKTEFQHAKEQRQHKQKQRIERIARELQSWNPHKDAHARGNPHATLFVGRLRYSVDEDDLEHEFSKYGAIKRIRLVRDTVHNKSRGYAFILFETPASAKMADRQSNGMLLKGRRIVTDTERGRIQPTWKPGRLGGGRGGRYSTRKRFEQPQRLSKSMTDNNYRPKEPSTPSQPRESMTQRPVKGRVRTAGGRKAIPRDPRDVRAPRDPREPPPVASQLMDPRASGRTLRKY